MSLIINSLDFPKEQYFQEETLKNQVVLHHTASPASGIEGDLDWWKTTKERVATHFIIAYDGRVYQLFDLKYWAYHINLAHPSNTLPSAYKTFNQSTKINQHSVGIELDAAGAVTRKNGRYMTWYNKEIPENEVYKLEKSFRGSLFFQRYSDAQLESLNLLLAKLKLDLKLDLSDWKKEKKTAIFDINASAYTGKSGIYSHVSYQDNKNDCYPDTRLLAMLEGM